MEVRTRYAPSPTGFMHVGNLRTALYEYLIAKSQGGKFILRIEDTDQERLVDGAVEVIYRTLDMVGLKHDEGPDVGGEYGPYVQSQRKDMYKPYAEQLVKEGKAYYCFCTKERLDALHQEQGVGGGYDRHCRDLPQEEVDRLLAQGVPYVIRQKMPLEGSTTFQDAVYGEITVENKELEDQILLKADGYPTYNFANVIDDHSMHITHVVRGCEYLSSAPKYNLLYEAFGWEIPQYIHMPPVMRDSQHKLSKRDGDAYFSDYVDKGYLVEAIVNYLALVGWNPGDDREFFTLDELVEAFDIHRINKAPGIFDVKKLTWFNAEYIRRLTPEKYLEMVTPWFDKVFGDSSKMDYKRLAELMQGRTEVFNLVPDMVRFLAQLPDYDSAIYINKKAKTNKEACLKALNLLRPVLDGITEWTEPVIHDTVMAAIAEAGMKNATALWPLRIAISGQQSTPGGAIEIAYLLGKEETLRRVDDGIRRVSEMPDA